MLHEYRLKVYDRWGFLYGAEVGCYSKKVLTLAEISKAETEALRDYPHDVIRAEITYAGPMRRIG